MRTHTALKALFVAGLLASPVVLAAKKPSEFQPSEMTEEDFAAAREAKRGKLNGYDAGITEEKPREIPWMFIILSAMAVTAAAPFAIRQYVSTAKDIRTTSSQLKSGMDDSPN